VSWNFRGNQKIIEKSLWHMANCLITHLSVFNCIQSWQDVIPSLGDLRASVTHGLFSLQLVGWLKKKQTSWSQSPLSPRSFGLTESVSKAYCLDVATAIWTLNVPCMIKQDERETGASSRNFHRMQSTYKVYLRAQSPNEGNNKLCGGLFYHEHLLIINLTWQ